MVDRDTSGRGYTYISVFVHVTRTDVSEKSTRLTKVQHRLRNLRARRAFLVRKVGSASAAFLGVQSRIVLRSSDSATSKWSRSSSSRLDVQDRQRSRARHASWGTRDRARQTATLASNPIRRRARRQTARWARHVRLRSGCGTCGDWYVDLNCDPRDADWVRGGVGCDADGNCVKGMGLLSSRQRANGAQRHGNRVWKFFVFVGGSDNTTLLGDG